MPAISVTSVLTPEELIQHGIHISPTATLSGQSAPATASSSSSSSSSSCKNGKRFIRKMSYPESYFRWLTQRRPSSTPTPEGRFKPVHKDSTDFSSFRYSLLLRVVLGVSDQFGSISFLSFVCHFVIFYFGLPL